MSFTFVHTDGPGLPKAEARIMRAHVTKTNFARRRERIATERGKTDHGHSENTLALELAAGQTRRPASTPTASEMSRLPSLTANNDLLGRTSFYRKMHVYLHLNGIGAPRNPVEVAWYDLIANDSAFYDASMAILVRFWAPDGRHRQRADAYHARAVGAVIKRIDAGLAHTDGVIGAVLVLAFGARLNQNEASWKVHIRGLSDLVRDRFVKSMLDPPPWVGDLLVFDLMNAVLGSPRVFHESLFDAIAERGDSALSAIFILSRSLAGLRQMMAAIDDNDGETQCSVKDIEVRLQRVQRQARALRLDQSVYARATAVAVEIFLNISATRLSGVQSNRSLFALGDLLRQALDQLKVRPCPYVDISSVPIVFGIIASEKGSQTRQWFLTKSRQVVVAMRLRGWEQPVEMLEGTVASDRELAARFKAAWLEESGGTAPNASGV